MLRYLVDPANAITATGILFSSAGLFLALGGWIELAVAVVLWAMLADHLDGVVAQRTRSRGADVAKMGKSLDGFADLVYGAIFPAAAVIKLSDQSLLSLATGTLLIFAGALRLSYFSNFGLSSDRRFMGVPLSYDVPLLAILLLARPWLPADAFASIVNVAFLVLAALHVASIRIPAANNAMYAAIVSFSVLASAVLAARGFA
jgi:CDP-diacylglycerol---serine O-phosphatidyltransferase